MKTTDPSLTSATRLVSAEGSPALAREEYCHFLLVVHGATTGQRFRIEGAVVVGRAPPADIVIPVPAVSRRHCRLAMLHGVLTVEDLGSTNGTLVDGVPATGKRVVDPGALLDLGTVRLRYERLSQAEALAIEAAERDLARAQSYVSALLPPPIGSGPVVIDWLYQPCAHVGGDGFGYRTLDGGSVAIYLLDVSGHGMGAAMHAVSVLNTLRRGILSDADLKDPGTVIEWLNKQFPMEAHDESFFTLWYGVYDESSRVLSFASAGHHAGFLRQTDDNRLTPLWTRNLPVGVANHPVRAAQLHVPAGSRLYLFSDGAFEFTDDAGNAHGIDRFVETLTLSTDPSIREVEWLWRDVRRLAKDGPPDDDVCILVVTFS